MRKAKSEIVNFIRNSFGTDLSVYDESFLLKFLRERMMATACSTMADYSLFVKNDLSEAKTLVDSLNITYSEFFRDPLVFAILHQIVFPDMFINKKKNGRNEIRIWSAAAASGQEAYSLAMLLDHLEMYYHTNINIHLFASDISMSEINKAKEGEYPADQLQNTPFKYLNKYFYPNGNRYKLIPRIRESVDFSIYDMLDSKTISPPESIYGSFDLIYCSNLLIYYNTKTRDQIIQKLLKNLDKDGLLITGESEREMFTAYNLHAGYYPAAIFQKK